MADSPEPPKVPAPGRLSPLKLIALLVAALAVGAGGAFGAMHLLKAQGRGSDIAEERSAEEETARPGEIPGLGRIIDLEQLRVNLNESSASYLLVSMSLEVPDDERIAQAISDRMPLIRDRLLLLLSDLRRDDVNTIEGQERLKQEIAARLTPIVGERNVRNVYFREFIIQPN